ncbi:ATP-binding cassette sub-family G member 5 [Centruroides vittatus]|uniref:ATP-binding cassette sub-family G member 5 n=1 Tax=Centruroides vittatus TaxID=120091 RepID=UPI0035100D4F
MSAMISSDHVLELESVFHSGQLDKPTFLQKVTGPKVVGAILKDVTMEVHAGEVMAILGSKGSGKRALLEVIARQSSGTTHGQILLNDVPISARLFQEQCCYVQRRSNLLPGLTVRQTLSYSAQLSIGSKVSSSVKRNRVKQAMADLALNQVGNREVSTLSPSEYKRLAIAIEVVRDPVLLLLDEPTHELDPLNTYFIISILSNHAKKYNRIILISMEKPRSDIFPFLDRVTYLCHGEIVYTGSTRMMLDYFRSIGFPCPELENPLMYYLCLSTVDRRSRERFIESSTQISSLVDKFKIEGARYRKFGTPTPDVIDQNDSQYKLPLTAYGQPSCGQVYFALLRRSYASLFNCNYSSIKSLLLRFLSIPAFFTFLFLFYYPLDNYQHSYVTRNGLILNCLIIVSFLSTAITSITYAPFRTRYYQESKEGMYGGVTFILSQIVYSLPLSAMTVWVGATIIYAGVPMYQEWDRWAKFCAVLWTVYIFAEHQTIILMNYIRSSFTTFVTSIYILVVYITLASGTVRSLIALPTWLYYISYGIIYRYAGAFLNANEFRDNRELIIRKFMNDSVELDCPNNNLPGYCVYLNGTHYLEQRYSSDDLNDDLNFGICFAFVGGMWLLSVFVYLIKPPNFISAKFNN